MTQWLQPLPGEWLSSACDLLASGAAVIRVSIAEHRGSAPRDAGACLLVTAQRLLGSIGGGELEWRAIQAARARLSDTQRPAVSVHDYTLGPDLNQCCGGRVLLWLERLTAADLAALHDARRELAEQRALCVATRYRDGVVTRQIRPPEGGSAAAVRYVAHSDGSLSLTETWQRQLPAVWIYGAGHVGQAILKLLADLPLFEVTCIDARAGLLPELAASHLHGLLHDNPVASVAAAPPGTRYLVMTHDHALDYALCRAVLARADAAWLGLIGSASKGARFRSRLRREAVPQSDIERLCSPIGVGDVHNKLPAAIAVSVVAQLLGQASAVTTVASQDNPMAAADCGRDCADCLPLQQRRA